MIEFTALSLNWTVILQSVTAVLIVGALKLVKDIATGIVELKIWATEHAKRDDERFSLLLPKKTVKRKRVKS